MSDKRDYYEVLGVSKTATPDEMKRAYRKLSRKYHPDMQAGKSDTEKKEAEEKFKELSEAYSVLSDADKRAQYDQFGFAGNSAGPGFDMGEFMRRHGGMFRSFFGRDDDDDFGPFGFRHNSAPPDPNQPEDGQDIQLRVTLPFKDVVFGNKREFEISLDEECSTCHGTGMKAGSEMKQCIRCHGTGVIQQRVQSGFMLSISSSPCPMCRGTGYSYDVCEHCHGNKRVEKKKTVKIAIPAGIDIGQRLRVKGYGLTGLKGGSNGDLYLLVNNIEKSDLFEKSGLDIKVKWPVSSITAALGGKIEVASPSGMISVKIPTGMTSGWTTRVSGKGIKASSGIGDLIVEFYIESPTNISKDQTEAFENLQKSLDSTNFKKLANAQAKAKKFFET